MKKNFFDLICYEVKKNLLHAYKVLPDGAELGKDVLEVQRVMEDPRDLLFERWECVIAQQMWEILYSAQTWPWAWNMKNRKPVIWQSHKSNVLISFLFLIWSWDVITFLGCSLGVNHVRFSTNKGWFCVYSTEIKTRWGPHLNSYRMAPLKSNR